MRWLSAVVLLSILNLGGCGNSGNPNAPTSKAPHETGWVAYHRNDIVSFKGITTARSYIDGLMINEHVLQCQVCHGAGLMGAKAGAAGPACLDCHVLDPVRFPIMCYSCHGGPPKMKTQQWYSTVVAAPLNQYSSSIPKRPGLPLSPAFISRVQNEIDSKIQPVIHIKHKAVPLPADVQVSSANLEMPVCVKCHGEKSEWAAIHHTVVMNDPTRIPKLGCLGPLPNGCHIFKFGPGGFTLSKPDCSFPKCHGSQL